MKCCKLSRFFNEVNCAKSVFIFPHSDWTRVRITPNTETFLAVLVNKFCRIRRRRNFDVYLILISGKLRFLNIKNMFHEYKSSSPEMFCKNVILKSFAKFTRKHLCRSLILKKKTVVFKLTKKRLRSRCFSVSFAKFLRTSVLKIFCKWLLTITICFMKIGSLLYRDKKI